MECQMNDCMNKKTILHIMWDMEEFYKKNTIIEKDKRLNFTVIMSSAALGPHFLLCKCSIFIF